MDAPVSRGDQTLEETPCGIKGSCWGWRAFSWQGTLLEALRAHHRIIQCVQQSLCVRLLLGSVVVTIEFMVDDRLHHLAHRPMPHLSFHAHVAGRRGSVM